MSEMSGMIIGYGNMGRTHERAAELAGAQILGIIDVDPGLTDDPKVYASLETFEGVVPDFVVVSSPTQEHFRHTAEVIERFGTTGLRGILLEKPPVRTEEEVQRLRRLSRQFRHIFVGEVEHYNPALQEFHEYRQRPAGLSFERLVDLEYFLHGARPWFLDEALSGGIVLDLMIHDLNLVVAKYGLPQHVKEVKGHKERYDITDNVQFVLDYGDFEARLAGTWTADGSRSPIDLTVKITDGQGGRRIRCDDYLEAHDDATNPYYIQMRQFMASLRTGKLPFNLENYLDATELALQIRQQLAAT